MSRNLWAGAAVVVVLAAGGWWYVNKPDTSAIPQAQTPTGQEMQQTIQTEQTHSRNTQSQTALQTIRNSAYGISLQVPQNWIAKEEHLGAGNNLLLISSPLIEGNGLGLGGACPDDFGCGNIFFSVSPPSTGYAKKGSMIDGTAQTFQVTAALPAGSSERVDNTVYTKVRNMMIGGANAVFINAQTAPDVATEPFYEDIIWVRKGDTNWYIYPSGYSSNAATIESILQTLRFEDNSQAFKTIDGTTFTLAMGQTATDGAITVRIESITGGQYPSVAVNVVSASSTVEAGLAETAKTWGLTQDEYDGAANSYLSWSAKWGDMEWHDPNSSTGIIKLKITTIDSAAQTVTFMVSTTPNPPENG